MEKFKLKISGVTCGGCVANIKKLVEGVEELKAIEIDQASGDTILSLKETQALALVINNINESGRYSVSSYEVIN